MHGFPISPSRFLAIMAIHLGCLLAPWYFTWQAFFTTLVLIYICACLGITLCYHRLLTHNGFKTFKIVRYTLAIIGCLNWEGGPIRWVGTHRVHHQFSDKELDDPHTPKDGGLWAHMLWTLVSDPRADQYRAAAGDLAKDPVMVFIDRWFWAFQIPLAIGLYYFGGIPAVVWGVFVRMTIVYHGTWFVNSAAHIWGYRNFETSDNSRNNWWVALFSFGEGWHNNHHKYPNSAKHGLRWFELDPTYWTIKVLQFVGLAWDIKTAQYTPRH